MNKLKDVFEIEKGVFIDLNKTQYITLILDELHFHADVEIKMTKTRKVLEYIIEAKDSLRLRKRLENSPNFEKIMKIERESEKLKRYSYIFTYIKPIKTIKPPKFIRIFTNKLWNKWESDGYAWTSGNHFIAAVIHKYYEDADIFLEAELRENLGFIEDHIEFTYPGLDDQDTTITITRKEFQKMVEYFFTSNQELVKDEKKYWHSQEEWEQMKKEEEEEENDKKST